MGCAWLAPASLLAGLPDFQDRRALEYASGFHLFEGVKGERLKPAHDQFYVNHFSGFEKPWDYVLEPPDGLIGIGSGGTYALAAARALIDQPNLDALEIAKKSMDIASGICVYTNGSYTIECIGFDEDGEGEGDGKSGSD